MVVLITSFSYCQEVNFDDIIETFNNDNFNKLFEELQKIDTTDISAYDKATWLYFEANYQSNIDNHGRAYQNALHAKKLFSKVKAEQDVADCNILLLAILEHQNNLELDSNHIIKELEQFALKDNDSLALISVYHQIAIGYLDNDLGHESINYFKKILQYYKQRKNQLKAAQYEMNIGTVFNNVFNNQDSALYYTKKAVPILKAHNDNQTLAYNYNNQALQYKKKGDFKKAIKYFLKADSVPINKFENKTKVIFYKNISDVYLLAKNYRDAAIYLDKLNKLKDTINDIKQNIAISEIKEQYDNEKLRADNLESEAKRKQSQNIAFGLGGTLLLGGIIAFLLYKSTRRKQLLAEQEKALETQKLSTVLKEQELKSIDAMIEGQEKERQRIANDLHDDLGGIMANVKLHFNALKEKQSDDLYDKTNLLIDEAYQKVRTIAHAKNSGVIAKQGLLKAINEMANKISASNTIKIDVVDHGLEQRLENSLELTIFRIIQELITNIIKHANASEATIHITNHDDSLNIMVEDNGDGFNPSQLTKRSEGMGISSIDKRVEHLNGTMTIESEIKQGSTIIIDIPL